MLVEKFFVVLHKLKTKKMNKEEEFLKCFFDANDAPKLLKHEGSNTVGVSLTNPYSSGMSIIAKSIYENERYCLTEAGNKRIVSPEDERYNDAKRLTLKDAELFAKASINRVLYKTYQVLIQSIEKNNDYRPNWNFGVDLNSCDYSWIITRMYAAQIFVHNYRLQPCMEPYENRRDESGNEKPLFYNDVFRNSDVYKDICNLPLKTDFYPNPPAESKQLMDYGYSIDLINVYIDDLSKLEWAKLCPDSRYLDLFLRKILSPKTYSKAFEIINEIYEYQLKACGRKVCPKEVYTTTDQPGLSGNNYFYSVKPRDWVDKYNHVVLGKKKDTIENIEKLRLLRIHQIVQDGLRGK